MLSALYDWAFSSDGTFISLGENKLILMPGDHVRVFSDRHNCWFEDGVVECTYRDGVRVSYGKDRYFGFAMSKGNTKFIKTSEFEKKIRVITSAITLKT